MGLTGGCATARLGDGLARDTRRPSREKNRWLQCLYGGQELIITLTNVHALVMSVRLISRHHQLRQCNHGKWPKQPGPDFIWSIQVPFLGRMFLILIDAHSKWIEAFCVASATSATTMDCLLYVKSCCIQEMAVMDSGTCFTSEDFEFFPGANGIGHLTSVP